jgi:dienelactone hydrolase
VSIILDPKDYPELSPNAELDALAAVPPERRFAATSPAAARTWQASLRTELSGLLGFVGDEPVGGEPRLLEETDRGDFTRRKYLLRTSAHALMSLYLLLPKGLKGKAPVVLAYAGHGYGVKDIVGLWEDGSERADPDGYHADFAVALARRGFVVAAPEISCFGERRNSYAHLDRLLGQPEPSTCHNAATYAMMLGRTILGQRVRDSMRLVDFLEGLPEADASRLGAMGISGGGMLTLFHAALDERVKAFVVSGYFSSFRKSVLAFDHCTCNFVPGLLSLAEMTDIAALAAPRPFLVEAGTRDPIFPIATVRESVETARRSWAVFEPGAGSRIELDEFEGRHRISGKRAYDFLGERLREGS